MRRLNIAREIQKHLQFLGAKIDDYLTPSISYIVTRDISKCDKSGNANESPSGGYGSPMNKSPPMKTPAFTSRGMRMLNQAANQKPQQSTPTSKSRKVRYSTGKRQNL